MNKKTLIQESSLGIAQRNLEDASLALKAAQSAFLRAQEKLEAAEEAHLAATIALANEVTTVRGRNKVVPLALR